MFDLPNKQTNGFSADDAGSNTSKKTVRLNLKLFATDCSTYPEFNYEKLLYLQKKKQKKIKQKSSNGFSHPFEENDDEIARLAKQFEKKYGSSYGSGRGRSKKNDLCDKGIGYDESDSFIDNTEAYDEFIPEEVETVEGGFYINCGPLEFKHSHTETVRTRTDSIIKMPKRVILSSSSDDSSSSSSDEDDYEKDEESPAKKRKRDEENQDLAEVDDDEGDGKNILDIEEEDDENDEDDENENDNEILEIGVPLVGTKKPQTNEKDVNEKRSRDNDKKKDKANLNIVSSSSSSNSPKTTINAEEIGSDSEKELEKKKVKTTTIKDMLKAKRDNYLKMQVTSNSGKTSENKSSGEESSNDESENMDSNSNDSHPSSEPTTSSEKSQEKKLNPVSEETKEKLRTVETKLPAELENEKICSILEFKDMVKSKNMLGKKFQLDDCLTEAFLRIDGSLLSLKSTMRNMVFAHLEYHLMLPKYFLLRKAKQLRTKDEKMKNKRALNKLRKAIIEAMPGVIANYELELHRHASLNAANIDSDYPPSMPLKKFPWTNNLRNLLFEVYQTRSSSYHTLATRKESLITFTDTYLRDVVVELWPVGWMHFDELKVEIEKRKSAQKKAKGEGKKSKKVLNNNKNAPPVELETTDGVTANEAPVPAITSNPPIPILSVKKLDPLSAANSNNTSDTDSTTSNANPSLKRKNSATGIHLKNKNKSQKTNKHDQWVVQRPSVTEDTMPNVSVSLSANTVTSTISGNITSTMSVTSSANIPQQKHSKISTSLEDNTNNIRIINLDDVKSSKDIINVTNQMISASRNQQNQARSIHNNIHEVITMRCDSSSESDGVEIVGEFPASIAGSKKVKNPRYRKNETQMAKSTAVLNNNNNNAVNKKSAPNSGVHVIKNSMPSLENSTAICLSKDYKETALAATGSLRKDESQ